MMCYPGTSVVFNGEVGKSWTDGCGGSSPIPACLSECIPESIFDNPGFVEKNIMLDKDTCETFDVTFPDAYPGSYPIPSQTSWTYG